MRVTHALQAILTLVTVGLAGCPRQAPPVTASPKAASPCELRRLRGIVATFDLEPIRGPFAETEQYACVAACKRGEREACVGWGIVQQYGTPAGRDPVKAVAIFEEQCQQGYTPGCTHLGVAAQMGLGLLPDPERGVSLVRRACEDGDAWACVALGGWYGNGVGVEKDENEARRWLEQACKSDEQWGCANLGVLLVEREESTDEVHKGIGFLEKACTAGVGHACLLLGQLRASATNDGFNPDATKVRSYLDAACKYGKQAGCVALGVSHIEGTYGAKDVSTGWALVEKACIAGFGPACGALLNETSIALPLLENGCSQHSLPHCGLLGTLRAASPDAQVKDAVKASKALSEACTGGEILACAVLGRLRLSEDGTVRNEAEGHALLERACRAGIGAACSDWLVVLGTSEATPATERPARLDVAAMGCRFGHTPSCGMLGSAYLVWNTGETATMAALLEHACNRGDSMACSNLGSALTTGQRLQRAPDRGSQFTRSACDAGNPLGCNNGLILELQRAPEEVDWNAAIHDALQACTSPLSPTCSALVILVILGKVQLSPELISRFDKQCAAGEAGVCAGLSIMYMEGQGVPKDVPKAFQLAEKACDLGDGAACHNLGIWYRDGLHTREDAEKALAYLTQSCVASNADGCTELGRLCWNKPGGCKLPGKYDKASDLLDDVCKAGDADACEALGDEFAKEKPPNAKAEDAYRRGCNARNGATSCRKWGQWLLAAKRNQEAADAIEQALLSGDADAATTVWDLFAQGWLAPRKIAETLSVGCNKGNLNACYVRGALLVHKDAPAKTQADEKEAVQLFKRACDEGNISKACTRYGRAQFCGHGGLTRDKDAGVTVLRKACGTTGTSASSSALTHLGELQRGDKQACRVLQVLEGGEINVCAQ